MSYQTFHYKPPDQNLSVSEDDDDNFNVCEYFHKADKIDTSEFLVTPSVFTRQNKPTRIQILD